MVPTKSFKPSDDLLLVAIAGGTVLVGVLWLGAVAAAWLWTGHGLPHRLSPVVLALAHPANPGLAWRADVGPPWLYWVSTSVVVVLVVALVVLGARTFRGSAGPQTEGGFATRVDVRAAAGERGLRRRASVLRPSLARPRAVDLGWRLGGSRGTGCWVSVEDSMLLVGPPRSGKGQSVVIPMVLDAPGAVVTTSTRPDNLAVTMAARRRQGPVAVFDPQGLAPGPLARLRWSPVRGCESPQAAMLRAAALVGDDSGRAMDNGSFWRQQTVSAVRCMLHAAALGGRTAADLYRWSHAGPAAKEAVAILAQNPDAAHGWDRALDAVISYDPRTRDSVWAMVANTFSSLADPAVLAAVTPVAGEAFDPSTFLAEKGSLYLLGTATGASATANLVAALVEDVIDAARRQAARSPGARLDPPLALVLDEAANYPLASLPTLMAEGGGSGITTVAVLQSLAQARDRWGTESAGAIWDAAIVKLILGGSANTDDLVALSKLIGDRDVTEWTQTRAGGSAGHSVSSHVRQRPILEPAEIRGLPRGRGLLLLRQARPIIVHLKPWTSRADARQLRLDAASAHLDPTEGAVEGAVVSRAR